MEIIFTFYIFIFTAYYINILWILNGFYLLKKFSYTNVTPQTSFSIIIPYRNEIENLPKLLDSIEQLEYPNLLFEVILIDDFSDIPTVFSSYSFQITHLKNSKKAISPKKEAINLAIKKAKNQWIVTTDADCIVPRLWLKTFDLRIQEGNIKMIAAPVKFEEDSIFISNFQILDFLSLQTTTIGTFGNKQAFMCNGANFCYERNFFKSLNGFQGNETMASGDDVFLLQKALEKEPNSVAYLQSETCIVSTKSESSWQALLNQRIRWASKASKYKTLYSKQLGISVVSANLLFVIGILLTIVYFSVFKYLFVLLLLKLIIDYIFLMGGNSFYKIKLNYILASSLLYPFFSSLVVFYSFFGNYKWKGRMFRY